MLQEASLYGFVRTILIILLVYYGLKILSRIFAPFLMKYMSRKMQQKFEGQFGQQPRQEQRHREGETIIDKMPSKNSASDNKVGEYIDYEEIE